MKFIPSLFVAAASIIVTTHSVTAAEAPVDLGTAEDFVILAKSGISATGVTSVAGDIGVSPIDSTAITGFSLILHSSGEYSESSLVTGKVYASDYAAPTPTKLTTAVGDMETAYTDAAGRTLPDATELGSGDISGMTLQPGLYKWSSGVLVTSFVTLNGGPNDVWIFQIAEDLTMGSTATVNLTGGAKAENIFWQVGGLVSLGTDSHCEGILLAKTGISMNTNATINGRLLAQTAVTLDANDTTEPRFIKVVSIDRAADGEVTLVFDLTPEHAVTLEDSTDLINWTAVSTETPVSSPYTTTQATLLSDRKRFYRAYFP